MGLLGDFLPKGVADAVEGGASKVSGYVSSAGGAVSDFVKNGTSNFSLASLPQKLGEGASKLLGSFGSITGFKNLGAGLPTADLASLLQQQGIGIGPGQALSGNENLVAPRENLDDVVVMLYSTVTDDVVTFRVSPRVGESRSASYSEVNITHHPGTILKYDKTSSRTWTVSAKMVSRTQEEASINQAHLNLIRSWLMPFYGTGTAQDSPALLGAPPPILELSGYGAKNISPVPCVLESYSTDWPNDVDYIPTLTGDPFPVIMDISLNLKESYSPREYSGFNLYAYKSGNLAEAFSGNKYSAPSGASTANSITDTGEGPPILGDLGAFKGVPGASDLAGAVQGAQGAVNSAVQGAKGKLSSAISSFTGKNSDNPAPSDIKDFYG